MARDSEGRRRRPSHSSSRDTPSMLQRDDTRTSVAGGSDYHHSGRHARSSRSATMPLPPAPPKAASAYAAPPSASRSYRTRRGDEIYETEVPRSAYTSGGGPRRRRRSELSADEKYRQMRVPTGLTSSSDQESEEDSEDNVLNRRSDIEEESESESEDEEESDDSSPTRRRGQRRDGQILSSRRQLPEPEQESSDDSDHDHNGAQLARTPSNSSGPEGHYRTPESQRRRQRLIEAPPASMPRAETMPFQQQKTPPRRKPERRRAQSEILDSQPPRSIRRSTRRSDPVILQKEPSPRKPKKQISRGESLRSNSNHRSSVLSSIISGSSGHRGPSSSKRSKRPQGKQPVQIVECVACRDDIKSHRAYSLKCNHHMCRDCIVVPFEMSIKDPKQMPPRCCDQRISLRHVEPHFDLKFKKKWNRKYEEYTTDNRLYCPNTRCADWIHPSLIHRHKDRPRAKCGSCGTKVCVSCNGIWHSSPECPQDEELQEFLKQAKEEGWTRCYKCRIMVDRKEGCNHMTCRCGAEFCMLCGSKWKSCDCEWFNFEPIDELNDYYEGPGHMDDIFDSDDAPPIRTRTYSQQMRRRRAQEHHDEELARRMQYDMSLEQESDEDEDETHDDYRMSGAAGDSIGLGIAPGHHDQYRTNTGRHRTKTRASPVSYEHNRRGSGHRTPPRSLYDRGGYVTEVNRKRGLRGSERGDRGDSMERRLADRFSEQRVAAPPPMQMTGFQPPHPHMSPSGMLSQPVPPPPMGGYPPPMRMPMCSVPLTNSPPMMSAPPHHAFGSFPPHQAVPIHHHQSHPRGVMPDYDEGEPRSSSISAGLGSQAGGNSRVAEWAHHVAPGPPEEKMNRRSDDNKLARVA